MPKVKYQILQDTKVCLSNGGKRQYFCPDCGSGEIFHYEDDLSYYFGHPDFNPPRNRMKCEGCGENFPWSKRVSERVEGEPKAYQDLFDRSSSHLTYERNHEPDEQGIWFSYTGFRYKDYYDIELFDGTIVENCRPNGNGWYGDGERDSQVKRIRLKPDSELDPHWHFTGEERIKNNLEMFGEKG